MKKTLRSLAVVIGVVSGLVAVIAPIVVLVCRFNAKHASAPEE